MKIILKIALLHSALYLNSLSAEKRKPNNGHLIQTDQIIESTYHYTSIKGDQLPIQVFSPKVIDKESKLPCAIFFHGGGWRGGSIVQFYDVSKYLASRGIVSMSVEYSRLTKEEESKLKEDVSRKRTCVIDGKSVIRWVKQNSKKLNIDVNKIIAGGGSAGGHISVLSMLNSTFNNPNDNLSINTNVNAFLLFCPAFTLLSKDRKPDLNVFRHLPQNNFPSTLFLVGELDGWKRASDALAEELNQRGADIETWMGPQGKHNFFSVEWFITCLIKVDEFLVARGFLNGETYLAKPFPELNLERIH